MQLPTTAGRHIKLEEPKATYGLARFLTHSFELAQETKAGARKWVTLTRTGDFTDPRYGKFSITPALLQQMVSNFDKKVLGQDVAIDVSHRPSDGAAGWIRELKVEGDKLRALVEFTQYGIDAVQQRGMKYFSAEYHEAFKDNEKQQSHGCVLLGAALTPRPVIKRLDPVALAESEHDEPIRTALSPQLIKELSESHAMYAEQLKTKLLALGLPADLVTIMVAEAVKQLEAVKDDQAKCLAVVDAFVKTGTDTVAALKAAATGNGNGGQPVTITLAMPGQTVDVDGAVARALAERDTAAATAKTTLEGKLKLLSDTIAAEKTLTPEGVVKLAADVVPLISANTSDDQVKALAALQLKGWNSLNAAQKLVTLGYTSPSGTVHITVDSSNSVKALQAEVDKRLGLDDDKDKKRFQGTNGILLEANRKFAEKALAQFDSDPERAQALHDEHKRLAGGVGVGADVAVPTIAERTVVREVLYNMMSLELMDVGTAPYANTISIPYSYRDLSAAGVNNLRRYERQGIKKGGVIQTQEFTYPIPQKLAFQLSSEISMLVGASVINWEPIAENMKNMIRIVGEDAEMINLNEIARSSDEFTVVAVVGEVRTADVQGTNKIFPLANFPVVKPRQFFDITGAQVGTTVNPITVTLNGVPRTEYILPADGSALGAGTYWVMDYNLGELRFVDQTGAAVVPTNAWPLLVSYSYSTNASKFSTDLGGADVDKFWDTFLYTLGARKALVEDARFYTADMMLMSGNVNNSVAQAKTFQANSARIATGLASDGSVGKIKDIDVWRPKAPGTLFGDTRVVLGQRGVSRFRMVKPWEVTPLEQARNTNGEFIDAKEAFGTQYIGSHTPTQLKGSKTSVILYSATGRVARVN